MITGKTQSGFAFSLPESAINNMELIDALSDAVDDNPIAVSKACLLLLGKDLRQKLYDYLRKEDGRVPIEDVSQSLIDIFGAFGKQGKNESPSPA
ncbi:MAG: hypothetical protein RR759_08715 [Ruthenibacterium sp.]